MTQPLPISTSMDAISNIISTFPTPRPSSSSSSSSPSKKTDSQHDSVYRKMENLLARMQHPETGVAVRNVKTLLSKIPSVFTGSELVAWIVKNLNDMNSMEAWHLAQMMTTHGYVFPINDHVLLFKADNSYYRFQTSFFWPSMHAEPEDIDYVIHLYKRMHQNKQRLELADYEAENFSRLQTKFSRQWEFISLQAETQAKLERRRERSERQVLESQEKAFWDVHRPAPGCINCTEVDIKKNCRHLFSPSSLKKKCTYAFLGGGFSADASKEHHSPPHDCKGHLITQIERLKGLLSRSRVRVSKAAQSLQCYAEQFREHDLLISVPCDPTNPWTSDNTHLWLLEDSLQVSERRIRKWSLSIKELLKDPSGRGHFQLFLEREFSAENLKFWEACQRLQTLPLSQVHEAARKIFEEYIEPGARNGINIDCRVLENVRSRMQTMPNKLCFEEAEEQILHLMKNDSYCRYIRSDFYKEFIATAKKKPNKKKFSSDVKRLRGLTTSRSQPILES